MKRLAVIAVVIMALVLIGIIVINTRKTDTDITKKQTKVGLVLNGNIDDENWVQSHYDGLEQSAKTLNLLIEYKENVPQDERCKDVMEELIKSGCEIIICNSYDYGTYVMEEARQHPELHFFHTAGVNRESNMSTYFGRMYQIRYLCGIVAGLQTETNEIGYVAAYDMSEVNRGINAFTLGVRKVNPEATVYVRYSQSWNDYDMTKEAAQKLFDGKNIDVMTCHSDSSAPYDEAAKRNIYMIGYNRDNSDKYGKMYLTSAVWKWENFYTPRIKEVLQDKFVSRNYWEGVESGIVDMSRFSDKVKDGTEEIVKEEKKKLEDGKYDVFYGPIYDNKGKIRVGEGESMTDEAMLNLFDWYVEGVVIDEE